MVARDGAVFAFGDARHLGSTSGTPITDMTVTSTGKGYWLAAADGRIFAFGDARALGAASGTAATSTVALAATPDGSGYWTASGTGTVRAYGTAPQYGAAAAGSPIVGIAPTPTGKGYWLVTSQGDVLTKASSGPISGAFGFLSKTTSGRPMRYDPCAPVRYVINPAGAPAGAVEEVRESFRRLGAATGISFVDAGTTTETHVRIGAGSRPSYQPQRYGVGHWAPILISWVTAPESGVTRPARTRSRVDFPTPFGPTTPTRLRGPTVRSTASRTTAVPRWSVTLRATREEDTAGRPYRPPGQAGEAVRRQPPWAPSWARPARSPGP
jgi:hypothetical protein